MVASARARVVSVAEVVTVYELCLRCSVLSIALEQDDVVQRGSFEEQVLGRFASRVGVDVFNVVLALSPRNARGDASPVVVARFARGLDALAGLPDKALPAEVVSDDVADGVALASVVALADAAPRREQRLAAQYPRHATLHVGPGRRR